MALPRGFGAEYRDGNTRSVVKHNLLGTARKVRSMLYTRISAARSSQNTGLNNSRTRTSNNGQVVIGGIGIDEVRSQRRAGRMKTAQTWYEADHKAMSQ
jgi:hypothetical protein